MSEREKSKKQNKTGNGKPTIGLLLGLFNEPSRVSIWSGVADMARERDVNLICFTGGMLDDTVGFQKQANILYDLVDVEQLDGLIIGGGIGKFVDTKTLETFYKQYQSIPTVSIGDSVAGVPSILADNYGGMYQVVTHLVEDHGYRRIAYIKGHENFQEHEERYRAYCDALKEYGLAFDEDLVVTENDTGTPHYNREVGKQAVEILLDKRQVKFEALIVNDDVFAYGVIEELQSRGIHIPDDLPIVGFNDDSESQYVTPPLTTVPYPYYELGRQAAEMLLTQLAGNNILERMFVPTRLGVRQSCSCLDPAVEQIAGSTMPTLMKTFSPEAQQSAGKKIIDILAEHRDDILSEVEQSIELSLTGYEGETINPDWFEQLLDAFGAELSGTPGLFLRELDAIMRQVVAVGGDVMVWQNAISGLRRQILPYLEDEEILLRRAENLWQQARVIIGDFVKRMEGYKTLQAERQAQLVNAFGRELINTADVSAMMDVLAQRLPKFGIDRCYLSLYQNPNHPLGESRLLLAYDKKGRRKVKETELVFPSTQLAPNSMFRSKNAYSLVVEPLYFREDQQGFVLFEAENLAGELYHTLREQISSALQSALLIEKRKQVEQELTQERDLLQSLMDTSTDLIYFKDLESRFVRISKAHANFFDLDDPKEAVGKTDFDYFGPEHAQQAYEDEQRIIKTGRPIIGLEEKETWPDGRVSWASTTKMLLRDKDGHPVGTFGISRDITERKLSDETLSKRATELEIVAQVSTAALNILDTTELLQNVVDLTKESFHLYHTHIYLLDDITNKLVLTAGAGEVGRKMVAEGWSIPLNREQSLVARAARNQAGVIVNNVQEESGWLPNKDLPHTRSELAVPLLVGERVLGVLDVQSDEVDHFTGDDIRIQTTLAAQVAVALENARLFEQAERADLLLRERVKELDCLNDIGREMEENPPPLPELLEWITRRIVPAMQFPELTLAAIEFEGQVYGEPKAVELPTQIVHGLYIGGEILGRIYIAYTEKRDFIDEESALLGGIATRVSGFIENRRLFEQTLDALAQVEQSQHFLRTLIDNIPNPVFYKDVNGVYLGCNRAFLEYLGQTEEELIGKTVYDLNTDKELADRYHEADMAMFRNPGAQVYEAAVKYADGTLRDVIFNKATFTNPDGGLGGLVGVMVDITERKRIEETLRENEARLADATNIAQLGYWELDFQTQLFTFTDQLYALLRTTAAQEGGYQMPAMQYAQKFVYPDDAHLVGDEIQKAIEATDPNYSSQVEHRIVRADGSEGFILVRFRIIKDAQGRTVKSIGANQDITKRKQAEEELRRLSRAVEQSASTVVITDIKGNIEYVNPRFVETTGYTVEEALGQHTRVLKSGETSGEEYKAMWETIAAGGEWHGQFHNKNKNGELYWESAIVSPIKDEKGEITHFLAVKEEITERKEAEAERERLLTEVQRLAAIVENHPDFIGVGTLEGNPLYLNPAGLKMMGLPLDHDVTTMVAGDFFTAEDAEKLMKEGIPVALEQGFWSTEANLLRADGKVVPVEETISIHYDADGNPTSFSITMHDITNRQFAATEQARLLAEVESSYRQYVQQEWEQYLQEQHQGQWHIESKQVESAVSSDLTWLQEEVIRERATKVVSHRPGNGTYDTEAEPAAIVSPISLRGQVIGTLNLQDTAPDRNWSNEEIALVEAVSEQLALTVENLRLFDDTQRRATREQVTRQITDKMHAAPNVDAIIQTGLTELAKTLGVSRTYVKLRTADKQNLNNESVTTGQDPINLDVAEETNSNS